MSDGPFPVLPLQGARFEGAVLVEELAPGGQVSIRGDLADTTFAEAVTAQAGCAMPGIWQISGTPERGLLWMSPDELLLLLPRAEAAEAARALQARLDAAAVHALVLDVSDARARFRLTGPHLREVMARLTPADMAPGAFPAGHLRRTRLAQVAAAVVHVAEGDMQVLCFRSVADYTFRLLSGAASPGAELAYF